MAGQQANRDGPPAVNRCDDALPPTWFSIGVVVAVAAVLATVGRYVFSSPPAQPHDTRLPDINSITYEVCGMYESFAQMSGSQPAEATLYTILGMDPPCLSGGKEEVVYSSLVLGVKSVYGDAVASASRANCLAGDPCHTMTEGARRPGLIGGGGGSRLERDRVGLVARATDIFLDKQRWKMYSAVFGEADCDNSRSHSRRKDAVAGICGRYWNNQNGPHKTTRA